MAKSGEIFCRVTLINPVAGGPSAMGRVATIAGESGSIIVHSFDPDPGCERRSVRLPLAGRYAGPATCGWSMRRRWLGCTTPRAGLLADLVGRDAAECWRRDLPRDPSEAQSLADPLQQ